MRRLRYRYAEKEDVAVDCATGILGDHMAAQVFDSAGAGLDIHQSPSGTGAAGFHEVSNR